MDVTPTDLLDTSRAAYAPWAGAARLAAPGLGTMRGVIIRLQPALLLHLAVILCICSGLGLFALASYAVSTPG